MWEITLHGKPCDILYFLELKKYIIENMNKNAIVVITFQKDLLCSIAVHKDRNLNKIIAKIYEIIIKITKLDFLNENLKVFSRDRSLNSYFISCIMTISICDEVKFAISKTKLPKTLFIRSFVSFKLQKLYEIWQKEVDYYNFHFSNNEDNYLEFLKFIVLNINSKSDILYLEEINNEMWLLDKKGNKMKKLKIDDEVGIITNLIMLAPKKIIINNLELLSAKVSNLISYIFEDRVCVML